MSRRRRFHTDTRLSENLTERGLAKLTGQDPSKWDRYILKELIDNSLGAVEESGVTPHVSVCIRSRKASRKEVPTLVKVRDNGHGISKERVDKIFKDMSEFGGTKRHYNLPTRGNIGNALMTILGIQSLEDAPLVLRTDGKEHMLTVDKDTISGVPDVHRETDISEVNGTEVAVDMSGLDGKKERLEEMLASFIALNPHVNFNVSMEGEEGKRTEEYGAAGKSTGERFYLPEGATTGKPNWFSFDGFKERVRADANTDQELLVDDLVGEVAGTTSRSKRKKVLDGGIFYNIDAGFEDTTVYELAKMGDEYVRELYDRMVGEVEKFSENNLGSTLGSVGEDLKQGLLNYLDFLGKKDDVETLANELGEEYNDIDSVEDLLIYYAAGDVISDGEKDIPYYFELAAIPRNDDSDFALHDQILKFGINQSPTYSSPGFEFDKIEHTGGKTRYHHGIESVFAEAGHGYYIIANLTCPNITYMDRGKQSFDKEPFKPGVREVVGKAVRKVERELRPKLNKLWRDDADIMTEEPELRGRAKKGFVKDFVYDNFDWLFDEGTDNGRLSISVRQFFYIMQPEFKKEKERYGYEWTWDSTPENEKKLELKYSTFSGYASDYEEEELGERVLHRDRRGFFVEPHSNRRVDLETASIEKYDPDLEQINNLLFVEKTGFFEQIHQDMELTKKYDIGLINAKGYNVIAGKDLIEKIQKGSDCTLYVLSDFDPHGLGISEKAGEPDALSEFVGKFDTERLGLRLEDVKELDLPIEKKEYSKREVSEIENMVERGEMSEEEAAFFEGGQRVEESRRIKDGQRVEVNSLRPPELEEFLIRRLEEEGVEKVKPEVEDIEEPDIANPSEVKRKAFERAVGRFVMDKAGGEIVDAMMDEGVDYDEDNEDELENLRKKGKEGIHQETLDRLEDKPPKHWKEIARELIEERESDGKSKKEKLDREIESSAGEWCRKNADVYLEINTED